jgi:type VI secretion system protein ImpM
MHRNSAPPGFYGKLPARADFVSRRLPRDFIEQWDAWLQQGLAVSETAIGPAWRDCYFTGALWRFALPAGACGTAALAGVMMPSVDAVGRSFPLMLGLELPRGTDLLAVAAGCSGWFEAAEALAIEALSDAFDMAALDRRLTPFDPAPSVPLSAGRIPTVGSKPVGVWLELPMLSAIGAVGEIANVWPGSCLWWTTGSPRVRPGLAATPGLVAPEGFAALFDGNWAGHGWSVPALAALRPAPVEGNEAWDWDV